LYIKSICREQEEKIRDGMAQNAFLEDEIYVIEKEENSDKCPENKVSRHDMNLKEKINHIL
jgi:hypothetical protein